MSLFRINQLYQKIFIGQAELYAVNDISREWRNRLVPHWELESHHKCQLRAGTKFWENILLNNKVIHFFYLLTLMVLTLIHWDTKTLYTLYNDFSILLKYTNHIHKIFLYLIFLITEGFSRHNKCALVF